MSIYERRTVSAYDDSAVEPSYSKNPHILKWWTSSHDQLIVKQIEKDQWLWYWGITEEVVRITPPETIDTWQQEDPVCSQYAWNNILMYFALSRAQALGFTKRIRKPKWKTCPLCNKRFVEDSLPLPLVRRVGIDHIDFCSPCLCEAFFEGSDKLSPEQVLSYLQDLTSVLQRVPTQNFGQGVEDLWGMDFQERSSLLQVLKSKPTIGRVKELFGSWLGALIEAGVLEDGTRRTSRGTQCLARDGHLCLSLGEKTIDDFLYDHGIVHAKEPPYPEGNFRADFLVDGVLVEYFGLTGDPEYDAKTRLKQRICKRHGIRLVSIYPSELISLKKLNRKLLGGLPESSHSSS